MTSLSPEPRFGAQAASAGWRRHCAGGPGASRALSPGGLLWLVAEAQPGSPGRVSPPHTRPRRVDTSPGEEPKAEGGRPACAPRSAAGSPGPTPARNRLFPGAAGCLSTFAVQMGKLRLRRGWDVMSPVTPGRGKAAKRLRFTPLRAAPLHRLQTLWHVVLHPCRFLRLPCLGLPPPPQQRPCLTHCCIGPGT